MAYKIRKSSRITEDIELLGENGETQKIISVDINIDHIMSGCRNMEITLLKLQKNAKKGESTQALSEYGKAITEFFCLVFGEENTKEMLEFFDGRYTDMFTQILPFYVDVVKPAIEAAAKAKRCDIAENYGVSRKAKRKLGLIK